MKVYHTILSTSINLNFRRKEIFVQIIECLNYRILNGKAINRKGIRNYVYFPDQFIRISGSLNYQMLTVLVEIDMKTQFI